MFKLYYAPGTCALASHIALEEAGASYAAERLDFKNSQQTTPQYLAINPKGRVPALVTDHGPLTETPAILAYIAQSFPKARLMPDEPFAFAQAQSFNSYLCSTVHINHAHKMRGYRWAADEVLIRRHETQGAGDDGRLLCLDRAQHDQGAVGDGRAVHGLRPLSVYDCAAGSKATASISRRCRRWRLTASGCRSGPPYRRCRPRRRPEFVGWAKRSVPTINRRVFVTVGTAPTRLCPPYAAFFPRSISRPMPSMMLRSQIEPGSIWARVG